MSNRLRIYCNNPFNGFQECPICFEKMEASTELKCGHSFHLKCIDIWLTDYQRNCPYCRRMVTPPISPIAALTPSTISPTPPSIVIPTSPTPPSIVIPTSPRLPFQVEGTSPTTIVVHQKQFTCCTVQ